MPRKKKKRIWAKEKSRDKKEKHQILIVPHVKKFSTASMQVRITLPLTLVFALRF
jgi:hypothetical protein